MQELKEREDNNKWQIYDNKLYISLIFLRFFNRKQMLFFMRGITDNDDREIIKNVKFSEPQKKTKKKHCRWISFTL